MNSKQLYFRVLSYILPYRSVAIMSILAMVVAGGVDAAMIKMIGVVIDSFKQSKAAAHAAWVMPMILFGMGLLRLISSFAYEYGSAWLSSRVMHDLRQEVFERMMAMPIRFFDQASVGVLLSRVTYDINQIMDAGLNVLTVLVKDSVLAIALLGVMFWTDWQLTLFCLIMLPGAAVSIQIVSKRQRRLSRETQDMMGEMSQILDESLGGQRIIKIFGGARYEASRFGAANQNVRRLAVKRAATSSLNSGFTVFLIAVTIAAIIYFAGIRAADGAMTAGSFVSFMGAMMMLQQPIKNLSKLSDTLHRGLAAADSVFAILDQPIETDLGSLKPERVTGCLSMKNLQFSYQPDGVKALAGINLEIAPGESVALVGQSGSGKTTLANLIPRFYEPTAGEIRLDGELLADYQLANLRSQIALVSQDMVLFNDSVSANIAYGVETIDMERVYAAANAAHATEFIEQMPNGFEERLGENGVRLSGGQRQRLAIARAIYKDAPVLILDEATSALDTESERKVQDALEKLMQGRTTLVIAHRLSTIEKADRIVVMQSGRIIESGTHIELIEKQGFYAQMHAVQFSTVEELPAQ